MFRRSRFFRGIDPRSYPIAVKITLGLAIVLLIAGVAASQVFEQVIRDSQTDLALGDVQTLSRTEGLQTADLVKQELLALSSVGMDSTLQDALRAHDVSQAVQPVQSLYEPVDAVNTLIGTFREAHSEFDTVVVVDSVGHILGANPPPALLQPTDQPNWTWFSAVHRTTEGQYFVSGPYNDRLTGIRGVHLAVPVFDAQSPGHFAGAVYAVWSLSNATHFSLGGSGREALLIDRDGTVLVSPRAVERGTVVSAALLDHFTQGSSNSFMYRDESGTDWLYGHTHLSELGLVEPAVATVGWTVVVRQDAASLNDSVSLLTSRVQLVLFSIGGLVALVVLFFSRVLFLPLRRLTDAAVRIGRGDLDTAIPRFPADEIGQLSEVLGRVVDQLVTRVRNLSSAVEVSRKTALSLDINQMLADTSATLTEQFGYPDLRIYLLDAASKRLRLQAAAGGEGERLLHAGHRLDLDETSLVGRAMLLNEPVLGGTRDRMREAGLVAENSELALPLRSGGQMLGGILIISRKLQAFSVEEIDILRLIADQLSASIQNAHLFEQSAANVREIEALNRRLTRQAWEEFVSDSGALRHTLDPDQAWPSALAEARQRGEVKAQTYQDEDGRSVLAAPLILRGEAVGTLAVTRPSGEGWTRDEVLLLEAIASRMAIIAEGIRLVDETSRRAVREQRVNEISASLLQRATSVETVLRSALGELGGALGSDRISLRIGNLPVRDDHQIGTGPLGEPPEPPRLGDNGAGGAGQDAPPAPGGDGGDEV